MGMNNITDEILEGWDAPYGYGYPIASINKLGFEGWTINNLGEFGVAIPCSEGPAFSERFASAKIIRTYMNFGGTSRLVLYLASSNRKTADQFAALCTEFVSPGENGSFRENLMNSPEVWWLNWKDLIGNKSISKKVYDVLGELIALLCLIESGESPNWNSEFDPTASVDIFCPPNKEVEVKSSTVRAGKVAKINNTFQVTSSGGTEKYLFLVQLERLEHGGYCINDLVSILADAGYDREKLEKGLESRNFEQGRWDRKRTYKVNEITKYTIDDNFPRITNNSFKGDVLPKGITSLSYTISLDGIEGERVEIPKSLNYES